MSTPKSPQHNPHAQDKQALIEMLQREQIPLRQPPRVIDRRRPAGDDLDLTSSRRRQSRYAPSPVRTQRPPRFELEDDREPIIPPLAEASADLQALRSTIHPRTSPRYPYEPPPSYGIPGVSGQRTGMLALIAILSIIVILFSRPEEMARWSNFLNTGTPQLQVMEQSAAPALTAPQGENTVLGAPTVDVNLIDTVLAQYGSPAAGTGALWYNLGLEYNIDPAYALAFFIHESSAGTNPAWAGMKPDGTTTHNVGNIICAGYPTCYGRFRDYGSWEEGIRDWYKLISREYVNGRGVHTVEQIIPIYAPSVENNVPAYVGVVNNLVNEWRSKGAGQ